MSTFSRAREGMSNTEYRINRMEHFVGALYLTAFMTIIQLLFEGVTNDFLQIIGIIWYLYLLWCNILLMKNRLNDCGWSGWWMLFPFAALVIFFVPGDEGPNKYGIRKP